MELELLVSQQNMVNGVERRFSVIGVALQSAHRFPSYVFSSSLPATHLPAPSDGAESRLREQILGAGHGFARVRGAPGWRSWRRSRTRTSA